MRSRVLLAALGVVALAALALGRSPARRPAAPVDRLPTAPRAEPPAPAPRAVDPEGIRDIFHFADASARPEAGPGRPTSPPRDVAAAPSSGLRLVGLVSRGGRLVAALATESDVVLAGPGETTAGVTVLSVDEEGVRIRRADGTEETLLLE